MADSAGKLTRSVGIGDFDDQPVECGYRSRKDFACLPLQEARIVRVTGGEVGEVEALYACLMGDPRGLAGGRVSRLSRAVRLLLAEGRLMNQEVGPGGDFDRLA